MKRIRPITCAYCDGDLGTSPGSICDRCHMELLRAVAAGLPRLDDGRHTVPRDRRELREDEIGEYMRGEEPYG